jgi:high-affinity iron transporter
MLPSFIITFREVLEMALIIGIVLSYLHKTNQTKYNNVVYVGIGAAILTSIIGAIGFQNLAGGFSGRTEEIFEGVTMLIGAALLTSMIYWMSKQKAMAQKIRDKVETNILKEHRVGLFFLIFVAILREGIETVIFLSAADTVSSSSILSGSLLGMIAAIILGYLLFVATMKINLKHFFNFTSVLLILFAAGLVAHGIHELQEGGVVPIINEHVWGINPSVLADGSYPILHEKGYIGSIFKGLLGYNGNPSLIEVISYLAYLGAMYIFFFPEHFRKTFSFKH